MSDAFTFLLHLCCSNVSDFSTEFNLYTFFSCFWNPSSSFLCWIWLTLDKNASCTHTHTHTHSLQFEFLQAFHGKSIGWRCSLRAGTQKLRPESLLDPSEKCSKQGKSPPLWAVMTWKVLKYFCCFFTGVSKREELVTIVVQTAAFVTKLTLKPGNTVRSYLLWIIPPLDNLKQILR